VTVRALKPEEYFIDSEPYYEPVGDEITVFLAAYENQLPVLLKNLKQSTRQRFVALEFDYPSPQLEAKILENETGIDHAVAEQLIKFAQMTRNLKGSGLEEGASTCLLVHAAKLITTGVNPVVACRSCIAEALTDDEEMLTAVHELGAAVF
jgi:nitric oxide reductase NorQ protein